MVLLAHYDRPERNKLRNLRMDQALTLLQIPWALAANPDVDVDSVLRHLGLRDPKPPDRRTLPLGADDGMAPSGS